MGILTSDTADKYCILSVISNLSPNLMTRHTYELIHIYTLCMVRENKVKFLVSFRGGYDVECFVGNYFVGFFYFFICTCVQASDI